MRLTEGDGVQNQVFVWCEASKFFSHSFSPTLKNENNLDIKKKLEIG